jgi:ubiquinone/menaquinone biosynthesis C-methylase UbiE
MTDLSPEVIKACCADLYQHDLARILLGDSFHPGGPALTERLGELLDLEPGDRVLDIASGRGTSAVLLATRFGVSMMGVDYGAQNVEAARAAAETAGAADRVNFVQGDAEHLEFASDSFDVVISECAFCTYPDKITAAREMARVVRPGGRLGLADVTRDGTLPPELGGLLGWIACLGDAQPADEYAALFENAGFIVTHRELHPAALGALIEQVRIRLLGAEILAGLGKLSLPNVDFRQAAALVRQAHNAVDEGSFGYLLLTGRRAGE